MVKEKDTEICKICKRIIYLKKDDYCCLEDFKGGVFFMKGFYHTSCYNNQIQGLNPEQKKMKKVALGMLQRANKLMNRVEGKPEEVYQI